MHRADPEEEEEESASGGKPSAQPSYVTGNLEENESDFQEPDGEEEDEDEIELEIIDLDDLEEDD